MIQPIRVLALVRAKPARVLAVSPAICQSMRLRLLVVVIPRLLEVEAVLVEAVRILLEVAALLAVAETLVLAPVLVAEVAADPRASFLELGLWGSRW
jgi:hypothetical protein